MPNVATGIARRHPTRPCAESRAFRRTRAGLGRIERASCAIDVNLKPTVRRCSMAGSARSTRHEDSRRRGGHGSWLVRRPIHHLPQPKSRDCAGKRVDRGSTERPLSGKACERLEPGESGLGESASAALSTSPHTSLVASSAPPLPHVTPFPRPKLRTVRSPKDPSGWPSSVAPMPCAASSMTGTPKSAATWQAPATSAG